MRKFWVIVCALAVLASAMAAEKVNLNGQLAEWRAYYGKQSNWPRSHGFKPFKRYEWDLMQRGWPTGDVPAGGLWEAYQQRERMPHASLDEPWVNLGPYNHGGRARVIRFHPTNPTIMFAGSVGGGLFKSTNAGVSWFSLTEALPNVAIGSFEIDPSDPQIMYLGTGEGYFNGDGIGGIGLLKSTDGGSSWSETGLNYDYAEGKAILRISIDPQDGQIVLASTNDGLYRSVNGGQTFTMMRSGNINELKRDPQHPDTLLCGGGNPWGANTNGIWRSVDNGVTWTRMTEGLPQVAQIGRIVLDFYRGNPQIVYAGICGTFNENGSQMLGVYRSVDNGQTWTQMSQDGENHYASQGWYDMAIAVKPNQSSVVISSGLDTYKSNNSGLFWTQKSWWFYSFGDPNFVHADHHEIVFHPTNPDELWEVTDGGIFRSQDAGENWTEMNSDFVTYQYYAMGNATLDTALAYCGAQDNGTTKWDGNPDWNEVFGGDGGYCVVDYANDDVVYAEWQNGHRARSDNGGLSFSDINPGIEGDGAWVCPMVLDPFDHNTIYTTTSNSTPRVWMSPTRGSGNWSVVGNPVGGNNQCLDASSLVPGRLYLASESNVFRYDAGGDWTNITGNLPGQWVTHVVPDRFNPDGVYVTLSGFNGAHVYKSTQAGGQWTNITGNLPDVPTNDIVVDLTEPSTLYVGTDIGVFRTVDGGTNWAVFGEVMPAVRVDDMEMQVATGKLRAATHGRGLWEIPTNSAALTMFFPNGAETFQPQQAITMRWGGVTFGGNVRIEMNRTYPSATWTTLFASTPNDGLENWTVTGPESDHVRFRISLIGQPEQADTSNADSRIVNPSLRLLWPNGGETVLSGVRDTVRIQRTLVSDLVHVDLNRDYPNGAWEELVPNIGGDVYLWPVQLPASNNARIRIISQENPALGDTSDANFILRAPQMMLVNPLGGEQIPIAQPYQIHWDAPEHLGTMRISLNRDYPGGTWEVITQNTLNDGVHSWSPAGPPSTHCRIRVAAMFDPNQTYVESTGDFSLTTTSAEAPPELPSVFELGEPYPNPFNPVTQIDFALPARTHVLAAVFNRLGQQVALLANQEFDAGHHTLAFDGNYLSSGIYFIRITAYNETHMVKAVLMK